MRNVTYQYKMSFSTMLQLTFIILKLTGAIDWSWWWVMSPLWIGLGVVILIFAALGVFTYLNETKSNITKRRVNDFIEHPKPVSKWQERLDQVQADVKALKEKL